MRACRKVLWEDKTRLDRMSLEGQVIKQSAKTKQPLVAGMVTHRWTQLAKPAEPAQHVRIAAQLRKPPDLGECFAKITDKVVGNISVFDDREWLQSQSKSLDLLFENLFEGLSGLTHDIDGEVRCARFATARAYSRQISWGASWT